MIISEKQMLALMAFTQRCAKHDTHTAIGDNANRLLDEIIDQQSEELKAVD